MKERLAKILLLLRNNLADTLSLSRIPVGAVVALLAYYSEWKAAALILTLAWMIDTFDGAVARRFGSFRRRHQGSEFDADGIGDFALEISSSAVVAVYLWQHCHYGWVALGVWVLSLISAGLMGLLMNKATRTAQHVIRINMIVFHGLLNIGFTLCWFIYMAFGLIPTCIVAGILVIGAALHPKPRLWLKGRVQ